MISLGQEMHALCVKLFPICRSITGNGVRLTLAIIQKHLPGIKIFEVPSGKKCFDWIVPKEWNIRDAYLIDPDGNKILDFQKSNLCVSGYSMPVNKKISLAELNDHLYSLPTQPTAVPYVTSYYEERWGFCISQEQRLLLKPGIYQAYIDSDLKKGNLTYGELILPGRSKKEVLLSTYICHPSLANDNLSGFVVTTFLAKWLMSLSQREYTYRIIFIPETIGSIVYLSRNMKIMKRNVIAGFNITCVGDDNSYSYLPSRKGNTKADRIALHVLKHMHRDYISYSYLDRGSDERQYCSPSIDLPVCSLMRTKYGEYPQYHTSLDNLELVTPVGLSGGYGSLKKCLECLENDDIFRTTVLCEPQLGRRRLYATLSRKGSEKQVNAMMDLLAYTDGKKSLLEVAEEINLPIWELSPIIKKLKEYRLVEEVKK
ncbi:MAG: DUF4910 domain-containing protein [Candidatus Omnitrophica bacterium]|nr:DUF4910 domain-containing protein [Candidatus Omnitrophota bacterium]